jgi:hypothetical protein
MGLISNGTTLFDAGAMSAGLGGEIVFIKKLTASSSATLTFVDGSNNVVLDNTYREYIFYFNNIHHVGNDKKFYFQVNAAGGSGFDETAISTYFRAYEKEDNSSGVLSYETGQDMTGTGAIELSDSMGSDNDQSLCGWLKLYNPSSTTFTTNYVAECQNYHAGDFSLATKVAGYINVTAAIDEVKFYTNGDSFQTGTITMYGIT